MVSIQHYGELMAAIVVSLKTKIEIGISGAAISSIIAALIPGLNDALLTALVVLITIDMVTGVGASIRERVPIQSKLLVKTALKFGVYLMLAMAAAWTDITLFDRELLLQAMIGFLSATEMLSIMENAGRMGYSVPLKLVRALRKYTREG